MDERLFLSCRRLLKTFASIVLFSDGHGLSLVWSLIFEMWSSVLMKAHIAQRLEVSDVVLGKDLVDVRKSPSRSA